MPRKLTTEQFIERARNVHNDRYGYELVDYVGIHTKVKIVCDIHGVFEQTPHNHTTLKQNCPICGTIKTNTANTKTRQEFIKHSIKIHSDRYSYELVIYKGCFDKIKITCPVHGVFEQEPSNHIRGRGCPKCFAESTSSIPEKEVLDYVKSITDEIIIENDRTQIINPKTGHHLELDVYIPLLKKAIEFNGVYWHSFDYSKYKDRQKRLQCKDKGIELIVIDEQDWIEDKPSCLHKLKEFVK